MFNNSSSRSLDSILEDRLKFESQEAREREDILTLHIAKWYGIDGKFFKLIVECSSSGGHVWEDLGKWNVMKCKFCHAKTNKTGVQK